jgi:hypothetical protein
MGKRLYKLGTTQVLLMTGMRERPFWYYTQDPELMKRLDPTKRWKALIKLSQSDDFWKLKLLQEHVEKIVCITLNPKTYVP